MAFNKNMMSGSMVLLILKLLEKEDMYGYQIIQELEKKSDSVFQFKEGTIYPVLHDLEKKKFVTSYLEEGTSGKKRKYYKITEKGLQEVILKTDEWMKFSMSIMKVIGAQ